MISIGIIGASGYTGGELLQILANHPDAEVSLITSERAAGQTAGELYPGLFRYKKLVFQKLNAANLPDLDLYFLCLPHGKSMTVVKELMQKPGYIIDFSADFRLNTAAQFEKWYPQKHTAPELFEKAAYGLPEIYRNEIQNAKLVANPGCYPTSVLLPLIPLVREKLPITGPIIIDSKSGLSGAGRNPGLRGHFVEANGNFSAYKIGRGHRHVGEIEEKLNQFSDFEVRTVFTPHLLPVNRGILSTIYLQFSKSVSAPALISILEDFYQNEAFVNILAPGKLPELTHVRHSNRCDIGLGIEEQSKTAIIVSCIDNLLKGASGQAVQNMNILFDLPETRGLSQEGVIN